MSSTIYEWIGVNDRNSWANLFSYSLLTATSLDLAASAAGRIDTEAARYLRMAQSMVRTRLDILIRQASYGPVNEKNVGLRMAAEPVEAFSKLDLVSSEDTAVIRQADMREEAASDLVNALLTVDGKKAEIDGCLIANLAAIIKAEMAFFRIPLENVVVPVGNEQRNLIIGLQVAAATIADFIQHAIEILKDKLAAYYELYVCTSCGKLYYELVDQCELCEASQALIVRYPFPPKGEAAALDKAIYERYHNK